MNDRAAMPSAVSAEFSELASDCLDWHDFRDFGQQEPKRDPGTAWERNQQTEYLPGVGRVR